jgi:hypothetical protein
VRQAVERAASEGVGVLGASNYYDFSVYGEFAEQARERAIFPLFGLEIIALLDDLMRDGVKINDPGNPGKMYICGKGISRFDRMGDTAKSLMDVIRRTDAARMDAVVDKLRAVFAHAGLETEIDAEAVKTQVVARHGCPRETVYLQERHIAQAFQEALFERLAKADRPSFLAGLFGGPSRCNSSDGAGIQNEIRSHLMKAGKPAFVPDTFGDLEQARRLILALGGIPVYPTLAILPNCTCGYEESPERLIVNLRERGFAGAEFIPVRNTPAVLSRYVHALRSAGLFVTAGTEHNTLDALPITPTCLRGEPIPEGVQAILWEGACVVAAHQTMGFQDRPGFVDEQGRPNPDFESADQRIVAFSEMGAAVILRYRDMCAAPADSPA